MEVVLSRLIIGYNNLIDDSVLSGGLWRDGYALDNIKNRFLSYTARSATSTYGSTQFYINLGSSKPLKVVAVLTTKLSAVGQYRIRFGDTPSFDPTIHDTGILPLSMQSSPLLIYVIPNEITAQYIYVEIDGAPISDDFIEIKRVFVGQAMSVKQGISRGAELGFISKTMVQESIGGVEYFDKKPLRRQYQFAIEHLTDDEAYNRVMELERLSDISEEVLLIPDSNDVLFGQKRNFLGRLSQLSPLKNPYLGMHQKGFDVIAIV